MKCHIYQKHCVDFIYICVSAAVDCVPVMTIDKNEPDKIPATEKKDESPNGKEITEKVIKAPKTTQSN